VYKIYSIEEAVEEDQYRVEEVDHRSHHQNQSALPIKEEVVNHQIVEGVEVVVEVGHAVVANSVNDDIVMRITIQII